MTNVRTPGGIDRRDISTDPLGRSDRPAEVESRTERRPTGVESIETEHVPSGFNAPMAGGIPVGRPPKVSSTSKVDPKIASAVNDFGLAVYRHLASEKPGESVFLSAPSITLALAMVANGAKGDTLKAIQKGLKLEGVPLEKINDGLKTLASQLLTDKKGIEMRLANAVLVDDSAQLVPAFKDSVEKNFGAAAVKKKMSDPKTADDLNAWVSEVTKGMIPQVVSPEDLEQAVTALANAIYFKGAWTAKFNPALTHDAKFTKADGSKSDVKMMKRTGDYQSAHTNDFDAALLPYGDNKDMRMLVVVPSEGKKLSDFMAGLSDKKLRTEILAEMSPNNGSVEIPRFESEYSAQLQDALKSDKFGMGPAFAGGADLSGMVEGGGVQLDKVIHKSKIKVNEEGTEAAAATVVTTTRGAIFTPPSQLLRADKPFFYMILDKNDVAAFTGTYEGPK
jgi:serine protease inhibitor